MSKTPSAVALLTARKLYVAGVWDCPTTGDYDAMCGEVAAHIDEAIRPLVVALEWIEGIPFKADHATPGGSPLVPLHDAVALQEIARQALARVKGGA